MWLFVFIQILQSQRSSARRGTANAGHTARVWRFLLSLDGEISNALNWQMPTTISNTVRAAYFTSDISLRGRSESKSFGFQIIISLG